MSASDDNSDGVPHPRQATELFGHAEAEQTLLDAYRSGRIPHAWLIGGERGIGKATLAYRMARFVLAHPDPVQAAARNAASLAVAADHPAARRIAGQAHSDLLVLERTLNDKGKLRQDIAVDDVRKTVGFFGSTAGAGGWRIAIVDAVDELNRFGENAVLKVLEEPPARSLLLLITHAPGRVLPTIRSRCRALMLRPLAAEDVAGAAAAALGQPADDKDIRAAAEASDGSVGRALMFLEGDVLELHRQVIEALDRLPQLDPAALHALGDELSGTEAETLSAFVDTVNSWLSERLRDAQDKGRMARLATAWNAINQAAQDTDEYNLDRKPFVFSVFGALADAAR